MNARRLKQILGAFILALTALFVALSLKLLSSTDTPTNAASSLHTIANTAETATADDKCSPQNVLVSIKSGGANRKYTDRRSTWRNSTCPKSYQANNIAYKFVLGLPLRQTLDPEYKSYRVRDNATEIEDSRLLRHESETFGDMIVLPHRDVYTELPMKTLMMIQRAVNVATSEGKTMLVFHDDENCLSHKELRSVCEQSLAENSSLYAGKTFWHHPHRPKDVKGNAQLANDGKTFAKYFDGGLYVLSLDLARDIVENEDTVWAYMYFPHLEDLIVGHWVQAQKKRWRYNGRKKIAYITRPKLMWVLEE